jgi:ABC-2 type transport system permease protein
VRRLLPVMRREYLERVRSKAFMIGTLVGPAFMAALFLLPTLVAHKQRGKPLEIAVLAAAEPLRKPVEEAIAKARSGNGELRFRVRDMAASDSEALTRAVLDGRLDGYVWLRKDALTKAEAEYYGRNVSNMMDLALLEDEVSRTLVAERLAAAGLHRSRVEDVTRRLDLKRIRLSAAGAREDRGASFLFSLLLMMMLYSTMIMWGQAVMTGVIEEKSSRVVEVVVSSISSTQLLAGKLAGVGAAGLTQFLIWTASLGILAYSGGGGVMLGGAPMPEITPLMLFSFIAFFLLGYFLYAALYAAIGASVNTVQEAQSLVFPLLMPLIVGVMFFPVVLQSPDSTLSTVLSLIPPLTPLIMFLRITVLPPPAWQIALSMVLLALTIAAVNWVAGRIYRVGILMHGKRPTFPEIMRWVGKA